MIAKVLGVAKATACWQCKKHWVNATSQVAKKRRVAYHQNKLVMRFSSMFPGQARELLSSLVACIGSDGSILKPLIVIPRENIDADIALTGLPDKNVAIYSQLKGFIDYSIFWAWFEDVFIPEICERCTSYQYARNIVLFMDNCTAIRSRASNRYALSTALPYVFSRLTVRVRQGLWIYRFSELRNDSSLMSAVWKKLILNYSISPRL
jgi:hypothetical protein